MVRITFDTASSITSRRAVETGSSVTKCIHTGIYYQVLTDSQVFETMGDGKLVESTDGKTAKMDSSLSTRFIMEQGRKGVGQEKTEPEADKKAQPNPFHINPNNPAITAMSMRVGFMGVRGHLLLDKTAAVSMLEKSSPLGQQLAERVGTMEKQGWTIERLRFNDPYLTEAFPNPLKRAAIYPALAGYNSTYYESTLMKRVTYNSWSHLFNQVVTSYGGASPATRVVGNIAHELGHWDRIPLPEFSQLSGLTLPEQRTVAMRLLQTETNAILPQLHVSQSLGAYHPDIEIFREALKKGELGSLIRNRWVNYGQLYDVFHTITPTEADAFVKTVLKENYPGVVNARGQIKPYDLASIRGKYYGQTSLDAALLQRLDDTAAGLKVKDGPIVRSLIEGRASSSLRRGGQALAGLGVAVMGADIAAGFYESNQKGYGKVGRAAFTWGAYEAGSVTGATLAAPVARMTMRTKYGFLVLPAATVVSGFAAATMADMKYGQDIENLIARATPSAFDKLRRTAIGDK